MPRSEVSNDNSFLLVSVLTCIFFSLSQDASQPLSQGPLTQGGMSMSQPMASQPLSQPDLSQVTCSPFLYFFLSLDLVECMVEFFRIGSQIS